MMIHNISKLAALIEEDSVPLWVKEHVKEHANDIRQALELGHTYEMHGPKDEVITIKNKEKK